jgi:zinc transport system permease protein
MEILNHFMAKAFFIGLLISMLCGPMGSLVLWQRMSFFGDTLAHASLLGVSMATLSGIPMPIGLVVTTMVVGFFIHLISQKKNLPLNTILAIVTQITLALGIIGISITRQQGYMTNFLFGDLLALDQLDLMLVGAIVPIVLILIKLFWQPFIIVILNEEIAAAEGLPVRRLKLIYTLVFAISIAIVSRTVGVLLVVSLLIIPAAAARLISKTPEAMAIRAVFIGMLSISLGLLLSWKLDLPTTPMVTITATMILIALAIYAKFYHSVSRTLKNVNRKL